MAKAAQNLFDLQPVTAAPFEVGADGLVTLVVPRFSNRILVRLLVPLLKRPDYRLRLDAIGSFVWQQCDGVRTVGMIGELAHSRFGGAPEPLADRVAAFVLQLLRERFLLVKRDGAAAG